MAIYAEQLLKELEDYNSEREENGKVYSVVRGYFDRAERWLEGREMEEKKPRFCFEIRDDETKLVEILNEKKIPFELKYLDGKSKPSLLKIFD